MAEPTIAEAISILTKVSADTASRLKSLEQGIRAAIPGTGRSTLSRGSTEPREAETPRQIVEKPKDVVITDFGPNAEDDLAKAFARETEAALEKQQQKNNSDLMGLLKLLGIGAAIAALANGEGIVGLVSGLSKVFKRIDKFAEKARGILTRLGSRISDLAKSIRDRVSPLLDRASKAVSGAIASMRKKVNSLVTSIGDRLSNVATSVKNGIDNAVSRVKEVVKSISPKFGGAFQSITSTISSWGASLANGMRTTVSKVAETATKVTGGKGGWLQRAWGGVKSAATTATGAVRDVAARGASAVGRGARAVAEKATDIAKGALKAASQASGSIMKVLRFALKAPVLAPILEGIFVKKDVNKLQDQHEAGDINRAELERAVGTRAMKAVGGVLGGLSGAALGTFLGPLGTFAGGVLGDIGGRWVAEKIIVPKMRDQVDKIGRWALDSPLFNNYVPKKKGFEMDPLAKIDDGIIFSQNGRVLAQANPYDTIYAMKEGGPLLTTLASGFESNGKLLSNLHELHANHMFTQIELDEERNKLLLDLGKLLYKTLQPREGVVNLPGTDNTTNFAGNTIADNRAFPTGPVMG